MRRIFAALLLILLPLVTMAQPQPTLIADRITVDPSGVLVADGNVQIWQGDVSITAHTIRYERDGDRLIITGPIVIHDGDQVIILASQAEMDGGLQRGILKDARFILDKRLQISAAQISREGPRYTQAYKVAATSCHICKGRTPIWQIRAQRMVHDKQERQIYFEHAQLRFFGIPILYLPRVRLPDPTLDRARGFLIPEFKNNTRLGFGVKTPYFIPLGKHKDLTLAPYLTSKTTTVELRYRQATRNGGFEFEGAVSRDELLPGETRGYLFGSGAFDLARDYKLTFDVQAVTDLTYFDDYRYSDKDRLRSRIEVSRVRRNKNVELRLSAYHSLRPADINSQLPNIVVEGVMERRVPLSSKLGEFGYQVSFLGSRRSSDTNIVGLDVARLSAQANWFGTYTSASGIILDGYAEAGVDGYFVRQDTNFPDPVFNSTVTASATLRWPWMRKGAGGGVSVIEPIFQLVHTEGTGDPIPNQDSTRVDFDFGNMFASNRAPGHDLTEFGTRLNVGLRGHHSMTNGSELAWSFGRVFRGSNPNVFSTSSGLAGTHSDWLIEAGYKSANGLEILNRNIIANTGGVRKSETRVALDSERNTIAATHTWLEADVAEARPIAVSELSFTGSRAVTDNWTVSTGLRYDFRTETLTEAELGAQYENECIDVNFSASRRFTGVASTDFGLKVSLRGFGTGAVDEKKTHKCGG